YPGDFRIKVEGLENYTINGKRLIEWENRTELGSQAHISFGYGKIINLDTEKLELQIPENTVFRYGRYLLRLEQDVFLSLKNGVYSYVYLDTSTNDFHVLAYNNGPTNFKEEYLFVCTVMADSDNIQRNIIEGINNYTINGYRGRLSEYENNIFKKSIEHPLFTPKTKKYIGHRGLSGLKPENAIPAFDECGIKGIFGVETDIRRTSDGHYVCIHDATVDRTTDGTGRVSDMTLSEIRSLTINFGADIGSYTDLKIPTLKEMLMSCMEYGTVPMLDLYIDLEDVDDLVEEVTNLGFESSAIYTSTS